MATVADLSGPYASFMIGPRPGRGVCRVCFNLTDGYERCYRCAHRSMRLDAVVPISYSIAREPLHGALVGYKRLRGSVAERLTRELAAVLWRYLAIHEQCVARAAGVPGFALVTTVPSGSRERDERHPLRRIVGELVAPTRGRYERLLARSATIVPPHAFEPSKFEPTRALTGQAVLLIDDTWTTGANAESAAAALRSGGAGSIGAVVIGRYLTREWHENQRRLRAVALRFDWGRCAVEEAAGAP
jgi:predicted amidophosphoribosyltransferase